MASNYSRHKPVKQIKLKIFHPGNKTYKTAHIRAPKGQMFPAAGVEEVLRRAASGIESGFPFEQYSLRQLGPAEFNFVWIGKKPVDESEIMVGGMHLGEVASVEAGQ